MILMKVVRSGVVALFTILSLSLALTGNVMAVECKGKSSSACNSSNSCSWVKGYTRSDGAKVSSFCRAKPGKSSGEKKSTKKKKATDTKKKKSTKKSDSKEKKDSKKTKTKKKSETDKKAKKKTDKKKSDKKKKKKKSDKKKDKKKS